jgi:hypothetical protein
MRGNYFEDFQDALQGFENSLKKKMREIPGRSEA